MTSNTLTPPARAVDASTVTEALRRTAASHPDAVALRTVDDATSLSWSRALARVEAIAGGLAALGVSRGDTVAIMLGNRIEFHLVDLAAALMGAVPFSIYTTYPADEVAYLIADAGARVAIVEPDFLAVMQEARSKLPELDHVILVGDERAPDTIPLSELEGANPEFDAAAAAAAVRPDDVVTLIYTSGTTGPPKGVQLTHRNIMAGASTVEQMIDFGPGSRVISWLPAAHIAERMAHHYIPLIYAGTVTICPNPREIVSFLPQVRPNWFFAVPRIWEKLKAGLETMLASQPEEQRQTAERALDAAIQRVRLRQRGEPVPDELEAVVGEADAAMFAPLRAMLGLDQLHAVNVGAAPTPVEVLEFFHALGIEVAELWGMSETCGSGLCNRVGHVKIGTVGQPAPGTEVKLADDGELLVRGAFVMPGYRNLPERTAEALDADGWLHTGDVAEIDADGFVRIVDRKKELIINAAGKNMSPVNIEAALKASSPLIGQACCIGEARPYNTALIVLDADYAPVWAEQHGLPTTELAELAAAPQMLTAIQTAVDEANRHLARVEQIKKFTLLGEDWLPSGDELTPTMKLKRRPVADKYAAAIEAMYAG